MMESPKLHRPNRQPVTKKCNLEGCAGCNICIYMATPVASSHTRRRGGLSPGISYAEAVTGSPRGTPPQTGNLSTGSTRGHFSDYVTPEKSVSSDTLSSPSRNDINENTINLGNQQFNCETTGPISTQSNNTRYKWKREEKVELFWCYCYAMYKQLPITIGTFDVWRKRNPDLLPTMHKDKLSNQRRAVQRTISEDEKIEIERSAKLTVRSEETTEDLIPPDSSPPSISVPPSSILAPPSSLETETEPTEAEEKMKEMINTYYEEVIVMFETYQLLPLTERKKPKTFPLTKENRDKLEAMNGALELFLDRGKEITLTDLNTLHYAAAVSLAGTELTGSVTTETKVDPDAKMKKSIESIRKTIGRLIAIQRGGKISKKMEILIGKKDTESVLRIYHMRLAAQSKKLRTKNSNRNRFRNNKTFRNKQKQFYNKLRYGESNKLVDPPSTQDVQDFWGNLYAEKAEHNEDAPWIEAEQNMMADKAQAEWTDIKSEDLDEAIKGLSNWKAPGADKVQIFG